MPLEDTGGNTRPGRHPIELWSSSHQASSPFRTQLRCAEDFMVQIALSALLRSFGSGHRMRAANHPINAMFATLKATPAANAGA
jgi:hypothetical protein